MIEAQGERSNKCCSSDGFRWSNTQSAFAKMQMNSLQEKQLLGMIHVDNVTSRIEEKY